MCQCLHPPIYSFTHLFILARPRPPALGVVVSARPVKAIRLDTRSVFVTPCECACEWGCLFEWVCLGPCLRACESNLGVSSVVYRSPDKLPDKAAAALGLYQA
eukprot:GHVU01139331.1.p1 GENE.GHVU01139331.1~~GHVU01139331.1.p1  ORF type:complete len:103 (+),score=1.21 GHVU01139331.1:223-531(+)